MYELRTKLIYKQRELDWKYKTDVIFYVTFIMFLLSFLYIFLLFLTLFNI